MYIRSLPDRMYDRVYGIRRRLDPEIVEMEKRLERQKGIITGIAAGIAIGSVLASVTTLLVSPDSGENNRRKAKEELEKRKELLEINLMEGKNKLSQIYEDTKEKINSKKRALEEGLEFDYDEDDMNILEDDYDDYEDFDEEIEIEEE